MTSAARYRLLDRIRFAIQQFIRPRNHQISAGDKFKILPQDWGLRYLYNIDQLGLLAVAKDVPCLPGHIFFGRYSKAAGEVSFFGGDVCLNNKTEQGKRDLTLAIDAFTSLGYVVHLRPEWNESGFPDKLTSGLPHKLTADFSEKSG
jgi:hypothetical protein